VPQSLYLLALVASKADDAVFYYNILREEYPAAVGLDALADKIAGMSSPDAGSTAAERKTGTFYSVQVGVFSQEDNAKRQAKAFSRYDRQVDISKKVISGQEYRVVYVGRFSSYLEAQDFKKLLEANHNEVFQVVAR
jgi:cell division septation protein DedD